MGTRVARAGFSPLQSCVLTKDEARVPLPWAKRCPPALPPHPPRLPALPGDTNTIVHLKTRAGHRQLAGWFEPPCAKKSISPVSPRGTALGAEAMLSPRCPARRGLSCPPAPGSRLV